MYLPNLSTKRNMWHKANLKEEYSLFELRWFGLVWFCGISTIEGYLMPTLPYTLTQSAGVAEYTGFISAEG